MTKRKRASATRAGDTVGDVVALERVLGPGGMWRWRCPCGETFDATPWVVRERNRRGSARCVRCFHSSRFEQLANAVPEALVAQVSAMLALLCDALGVARGRGATLAERAAVAVDFPTEARRAAVAAFVFFTSPSAQRTNAPGGKPTRSGDPTT